MKFKKSDLALAASAVDAFRNKRAIVPIKAYDKEKEKYVRIGEQLLFAWFANVVASEYGLRFRAASPKGKIDVRIDGDGEPAFIESVRTFNPETLFRAAGLSV